MIPTFQSCFNPRSLILQTKLRFAALVTDALRAQVLQLCGYRTQVVEFIDMEHTAKNILIRAVRSDTVLKNPDARNGLIRAYREFKELLGIKLMYLEEALGSDFLRQLESEPSNQPVVD